MAVHTPSRADLGRQAICLLTMTLSWTAVLTAEESVSLARAATIGLCLALWTGVAFWMVNGHHPSLDAKRTITTVLLVEASFVVAVTAWFLDSYRNPSLGAHTFALGAICAVATMMTANWVVDRSMNRRHRNEPLGERVLVVADGDEASRLVDLVGQHHSEGWEVGAVVGRCSFLAATREVDWAGAEADLTTAVHRRGATGILVAAPALSHDALRMQLSALSSEGVNVYVDAGLEGFDHRRLRVAPLGRDPFIRVEHAKLPTAQRFVKRLLDLVVGALLLLVFGPVLAVAAIAVKVEDGGPIFFAQERVGRGGRTFRMLKLRTMCVDAEQRLGELHHLNERAGGPLFKLSSDPRVTRIGRVLRATSLDELPQLFQVLSGTMSLVGPRPALPSEVAVFDPRLAGRHQVKPGITGLWQVEERDSASFDAYRKLDLFYVENWSLLLDLAILFHTVPAVIARAWDAWRGARRSPIPSTGPGFDADRYAQPAHGSRRPQADPPSPVSAGTFAMRSHAGRDGSS